MRKTIPVYNSRHWQLSGIRSTAEIIMLTHWNINSLNQAAIQSSGTSTTPELFYQLSLFKRIKLFYFSTAFIFSLWVSSRPPGKHSCLSSSGFFESGKTGGERVKNTGLFVNKQWLCFKRAWLNNGSHGQDCTSQPQVSFLRLQHKLRARTCLEIFVVHQHIDNHF